MDKYNAYPEYKNSGVEWLGKVPLDWNLKRLKYLCSVTTGDKDNIHKSDEGEFPFFVRSKKIERINTYSFDGEAVLTAGDGDIGKIFHYVNGKFDFHQRVYKFSDFSNVLAKYFYYYISCHLADEVVKLSAKTTVDSLRLPMLQNFLFCIPSLKEQVKITGFLESETTKIDTLIEKQQQLIKLLKEKRQAVITHAVTRGLNPEARMKDSGVEWLGEVPEHWSFSQIGHCAFVTKLTGFEYTNVWETDVKGEVIALRGFNIKERKLDLKNVERISTRLSKKLERSKLAKGDIVFPCTGTIGNAAMIEVDEQFHINQNIAKVRFDRLISPRFAIYWLTSTYVRTTIDRNNTSGMQPVVLIGDIRKLPMPRMDFQEQEIIADYLDLSINRFDELISKALGAIELMQERRTALISAAVTGKIDVRNWKKPEVSKEEVA